MGAVDYWCNLFTPQGIKRLFTEPKEIADVVSWWGLKYEGMDYKAFSDYMDKSGVDVVIVPSAKMASCETKQLIWDISEEEVSMAVQALPKKVRGLFGINPNEGMVGVKRMEKWMSTGEFVGAHLHTYGFDLPVNHRKYYPFYAKCAELGVPVVMQVGHSAERMPSKHGQPLLMDDIAMDFPELVLVGAHTGWPWVEELLALAWKHKNVYVGTSAHHPKYWDQKLVQFINSRGKGKVLYGTDYPVLDFAGSLGAIKDLKLKSVAEELLIGGAARQVFKIDA